MSNPNANKRRRVQILRQARLSDLPEDLPRMTIAPTGNSFNPSLAMMTSGAFPFMGSGGINPMTTSTTSDSAEPTNHITFYNYADFTSGQKYPQTIVNGRLEDTNEVVRAIVTQREPARPIITDFCGTTGENVSTVCPLSHVLITCPARGVNCRHAACFDLRQFLMLCPGDSSICPICKQPISFDELRFDPSFFKPKQANKGLLGDSLSGESLDMIWN